MTELSRDATRQIFYTAWKKYLAQTPLEPLEVQVVEIILLHPEYHEFLANPEHSRIDEASQTNLFFHLGLHIALREQLSTNRPYGIQEIFHALTKKLQDQHLAEHKMMDCLAQILWDAQQTGTMSSEEEYIERLKKLC